MVLCVLRKLRLYRKSGHYRPVSHYRLWVVHSSNIFSSSRSLGNIVEGSVINHLLNDSRVFFQRTLKCYSTWKERRAICSVYVTVNSVNRELLTDVVGGQYIVDSFLYKRFHLVGSDISRRDFKCPHGSVSCHCFDFQCRRRTSLGVLLNPFVTILLTKFSN